MSTPNHGALAVLQDHVPSEESRRMVRTMAACGLKPDQMSLVLNIPTEELERVYFREIKTGALEANVQVGSTILGIAIDRNHPQCMQAATFWQRAMAGWRDVRKVETATADLPDEQKQKLINTILERIQQPAADFIRPEKVPK